MKIMGLDPSIGCTGFALPDRTTFAVKPRSKGDDRLEEIADHLHVAVMGCGADLVVMEGLFGIYKGEAARVIPMLHGAVRLELRRLKVPYVLVNPTTLKRFATGRSSANKTDMALAALKRLGREYGTDDECDADWLRIAGLTVYGSSETVRRPDETGTRWPVRVLSMPQDQVQALRTGVKGVPIEWPVVGSRSPWPVVGLRGVVTYDEEQPHRPGKAVLCGMCARLGNTVCR